MRYKELRDAVLGKEDKTAERELIADYRRTFGTDHGKRVLTHMLLELGVFKDTEIQEGDVALMNYGRHLLRRLGVWEPHMAKDVVGHLLAIPIITKEEK